MLKYRNGNLIFNNKFIHYDILVTSRREFIHFSLKSNFSLKVYTVNAQFSGMGIDMGLTCKKDNYNHEFQSKKSGL